MKLMTFKQAVAAGVIAFFIAYGFSIYSYQYDWDKTPVQYFGFTLQGLISFGIVVIIYFINKKGKHDTNKQKNSDIF